MVASDAILTTSKNACLPCLKLISITLTPISGKVKCMFYILKLKMRVLDKDVASETQVSYVRENYVYVANIF